MCPIETPEGPNIGLIGSLASYGRDQPVRFHRDALTARSSDGQVTDDVDYLTADEEDRFVILRRPTPRLNDDMRFSEARVLVRRRGGEVDYVPR
ncbi:hypothetical protein LV779_22340 [Streptomyces thinghirensis]|nr:hypothetical protein [Streptomyces thinghirensis]